MKRRTPLLALAAVMLAAATVPAQVPPPGTVVRPPEASTGNLRGPTPGLARRAASARRLASKPERLR